MIIVVRQAVSGTDSNLSHSSLTQNHPHLPSEYSMSSRYTAEQQQQQLHHQQQQQRNFQRSPLPAQHPNNLERQSSFQSTGSGYRDMHLQEDQRRLSQQQQQFRANSSQKHPISHQNPLASHLSSQNSSHSSHQNQQQYLSRSGSLRSPIPNLEELSRKERVEKLISGLLNLNREAQLVRRKMGALIEKNKIAVRTGNSAHQEIIQQEFQMLPFLKLWIT